MYVTIYYVSAERPDGWFEVPEGVAKELLAKGLVKIDDDGNYCWVSVVLD